MASKSKLVVGVTCGVVMAGLIALATPAVAFVGDTIERARTAASVVETGSPQPAGSLPAFNGELTDYSGWTDEQLAEARAEDPFPVMVNHPSRFAGDCRQNSVMTKTGALQGAQTLVDMGPSALAAGAVERTADGRIKSYTVAAGDAGDSIGERFCVDYVTVFQFNHVWPYPQPGDVLSLLPAGAD
ncbi:hypothetical protein [Microbacterium trichothecenolyticum]|uniref:LysM domain-containing protein n=1 Tax=Microbacterium trichothecenolyticum TaxID=69370 RepID=A0ABU0TZL4_MICTR|nr:hypothetical protein [Microbacterium trichothecenolyticum]MDQ1124950.1 hypothetical protein [Microbacterium trichothecenolyticum]